MYGHAHMLLPENACHCGKPGVLLVDGKKMCGRHGLEAEEALLPALEVYQARVPAHT